MCEEHCLLVCHFVLSRKGCNNALGLLGVLGLAAYLQSILAQTRNATGRRRRSVSSVGVQEQTIKMEPSELGRNLENAADDLSRESDKIIESLLPALSAVAHARDRLIPVNCTYLHICTANKLLVNSVGSIGRSVGALLSSEIGKLLIEVDRRRGPVILKSVNKVAQLGRSGHDCNLHFQNCDQLGYLPIYKMPPNLGGSDASSKHHRYFLNGKYREKRQQWG